MHHPSVNLYLVRSTSIYSFCNKIGSGLWKRGTRDHDGGEEKDFVERGRRCAYRKGKGRGMQGKVILVKTEDRQAAVGSE